jgi:glycerophosphoryl diester phosphodiesterase
LHCDNPKIIAHRGASGDFPENTIRAFAEAWRSGADGVECDLRLSADRNVIVIHDADGRRTLGDERAICALTLEEIVMLDAGMWRGEIFRGERVPTLGEMLNQTPPGKECVLELKEGLELLESVVVALREVDFERTRITLIAFDYDVIAEARRRIPQAHALWLVSRSQQFHHGTKLAHWLVDKVKCANLHGVDLGFGPQVSRGLVSQLHRNGCAAYVYTINTAAAFSACIHAGVDAITSDFPARWPEDRMGNFR